MLTVGLRNLRFHSQHGVHPEETLLGGAYEVDVAVVLAAAATTTSALSETVDYGTLHRIVSTEMEHATPLLETIAERIATRIWSQHGAAVARLDLEIRKLAPPLGGQAGQAFVRLSQGSGDVGTNLA